MAIERFFKIECDKNKIEDRFKSLLYRIDEDEEEFILCYENKYIWADIYEDEDKFENESGVYFILKFSSDFSEIDINSFEKELIKLGFEEFDPF